MLNDTRKIIRNVRFLDVQTKQMQAVTGLRREEFMRIRVEFDIPGWNFEIRCWRNTVGGVMHPWTVYPRTCLHDIDLKYRNLRSFKSAVSKRLLGKDYDEIRREYYDRKS